MRGLTLGEPQVLATSRSTRPAGVVSYACAQARDSSTAPALILPSQFFELVGKCRFTSEQRLMLAVLADAINILQDWRSSLSVRKRRLFIEAARWVMTHGSSVPFSFDNVCDALEISSGALRHRLSTLGAGSPVSFP